MATKNNPGANDCYTKAEPDEPLFTLLGRDPIAPWLVLLWAECRQRMVHQGPPKNAEELYAEQEKIKEAGILAMDLAKWAESKGKTELLANARLIMAELIETYTLIEKPDAISKSPDVQSSFVGRSPVPPMTPTYYRIHYIRPLKPGHDNTFRSPPDCEDTPYKVLSHGDGVVVIWELKQPPSK